MSVLKKMRIQQGVSQEYIAKMMQVTPATVSRWENGEFLPKSEKLLALAKLLNCTVDELLKGSDNDERH